MQICYTSLVLCHGLYQYIYIIYYDHIIWTAQNTSRVPDITCTGGRYCTPLSYSSGCLTSAGLHCMATGENVSMETCVSPGRQIYVSTSSSISICYRWRRLRTLHSCKTRNIVTLWPLTGWTAAEQVSIAWWLSHMARISKYERPREWRQTGPGARRGRIMINLRTALYSIEWV